MAVYKLILRIINNMLLIYFFLSRRKRQTRCALVTGVQTCTLPISSALYPIGRDPAVPAGTLCGNTFLLNLVDPYGGMTQSRDLREIASFRDPVYRAKSDILALNLDMDLSDSLTLTSQTAWNWDSV